jgi:hypothetical protein
MVNRSKNLFNEFILKKYPQNSEDNIKWKNNEGYFNLFVNDKLTLRGKVEAHILAIELKTYYNTSKQKKLVLEETNILIKKLQNIFY